MSIEEMMRAIYDREANIIIESFWDAGYCFSIGDETNGISDCEDFFDFRRGVEWLYDEIVVKGDI